MAKKCLFCTNAANSKEHLWSDWILKDLKSASPIHVKIRKGASTWVDKPEIQIKCVCRQCNQSWMSDLETENQPQIQPMMRGVATVLKPAQQRSLARWALLKTMVLESVCKLEPPFFAESEHHGIKPPSPFLPLASRVWIGKLSVRAFHAGTTHTLGEINSIPKAFHGCIATIIVGNLVLQILIMHVIPMFATEVIIPKCKPGAWDIKLRCIWPVFGDVRWPPPSIFTLDKTDGIGTLVNRWKIGTEIV